MRHGTDDTDWPLSEREAGRHEHTHLAERIATTPHDDLSLTDVEAFGQLLETVDEALGDGDATTAAAHLAAFWEAYLRAGLQAERDDVPSEPRALVEAGNEAGLVGMDLYQGLLRFFDVVADATASDADTPSTLENWTRRILDLTGQLSDHVDDHHS
ncbi:hypothetical protein ACFR9U_15740 [Halorientalis brevis]|uniref:Uncharacterized protein n=1 Tax=Halorientalis brevis TaxID=1126241 RepID=A0ABD6CDT0_9EURY|nr:hypothetical protein [Halorientalis brevis]